jgi:hypothetical protein
MNFEDLKVVWDAQNEESVYAIDQTGLHKQVEQTNQAFNRSIFWRDVREVGIGVVVGILMFVLSFQKILFDKSWLSDAFHLQPNGFDAGLLFLSGCIWFYYAAYRFIGRKRQEQYERQFDVSLMGDLQKACAQVDYQIRLSKNVHWWGLLPIFWGTGLQIFVLAKPKLISMWLKDPAQASLFLGLMVGVMLVAFVLDYWCKRKPIQDELLPRKRELEALRDKLMMSESD